MDSLCHPWFTTTNLSYRFPIFETSATALCGTTGIFIYVCRHVYRHSHMEICNPSTTPGRSNVRVAANMFSHLFSGSLVLVSWGHSGVAPQGQVASRPLRGKLQMGLSNSNTCPVDPMAPISNRNAFCESSGENRPRMSRGLWAQRLLPLAQWMGHLGQLQNPLVAMNLKFGTHSIPRRLEGR